MPAAAVAIGPDADDGGYWIVTADGSVTPVGDAPTLGSMAGTTLAAPVVDIAVTSSGRGYQMAGADGGVFAFGDASYQGGLPERRAPAQGATPSGHGGE